MWTKLRDQRIATVTVATQARFCAKRSSCSRNFSEETENSKQGDELETETMNEFAVDLL